MPFLSNLQTRPIFFYLTIVCNLATCLVNATQTEDETHLLSGCRYTYPSFVTPYVISCRNVYITEVPSHDNVTKMELINVPLSVLNETLIPLAIQSNRVDLRQLQWIKSHILQIGKIPIPNLIELDLSWNIIQDIRPNSLGQLVNLKKFNLSYNNIDELPSNLFDERNSLTILCLSHNRLKTLRNDVFDALKGLEILDLSSNHLSHVNETLFQHNSKMKNLNLSHNKISVLPTKIFSSLISLQYLWLEDNHLFTLERDTFTQLHELMVLNLGRNAFWSLPNTLLPNNNTLFILTISHTRLKKVKLNFLQNLLSLRSLHLTDNAELENLQNDTFQNLRNLKTISLENNNFTQLPYSILDTKTTELHLSGNPWPCDCSIQWIPIWFETINDGRKNGLHWKSKCNDTNEDLLQTLFEMQCKPTIIYISPISYQKSDATVHLTCRAYANPLPQISWLTPSGYAHLESTENINELSQYESNIAENHYHWQTASINVILHPNGDLYVNHMSRDDAGEYVCFANNKIGESFKFTRLYADPSVMERIKIGSMICGFLWMNTFIVFSALYLLIRKYSRRSKQEKRTKRMQKNMDVYKSQQINRLRERCRNQMNRIKNNCSIQVDWMKENYKESMSNSQDHRSSYMTNHYSEQMSEIREYYLTQMHQVREHYEQQRNLILEFSINRISNEDPPASDTAAVKLENGTLQLRALPEEEEIYKYNDKMKSEIHFLTSLRNLHDIFTEATTSHCRNGVASYSDNITANLRSSLAETMVSNGKLSVTEDEGDENTSMLPDIR